MPKKPQGDFKRRKLKVGKKLTRANDTNTSFKFKTLKVPTQSMSEASSEIATYRQHSLDDVVRQSHHHNTDTRKGAMHDFGELWSRHSSAMRSQLGKTLTAIIERVKDEEQAVRYAAFITFRKILPEVTPQEIAPFLKLIVVHICIGLTKLQSKIRLDALGFLGSLVEFHKDALWPYLSSVMPTLLDMLGASAQDLVTSSFIVQLQWLQSIGFNLTRKPNPATGACKISSVEARLIATAIIQRLLSTNPSHQSSPASSSSAADSNGFAAAGVHIARPLSQHVGGPWGEHLRAATTFPSALSHFVLAASSSTTPTATSTAAARAAASAGILGERLPRAMSCLLDMWMELTQGLKTMGSKGSTTDIASQTVTSRSFAAFLRALNEAGGMPSSDKGSSKGPGGLVVLTQRCTTIIQCLRVLLRATDDPSAKPNPLFPDSPAAVAASQTSEGFITLSRIRRYLLSAIPLVPEIITNRSGENADIVAAIQAVNSELLGLYLDFMCHHKAWVLRMWEEAGTKAASRNSDEPLDILNRRLKGVGESGSRDDSVEAEEEEEEEILAALMDQHCGRVAMLTVSHTRWRILRRVLSYAILLMKTAESPTKSRTSHGKGESRKRVEADSEAEVSVSGHQEGLFQHVQAVLQLVLSMLRNSVSVQCFHSASTPLHPFFAGFSSFLRSIGSLCSQSAANSSVLKRRDVLRTLSTAAEVVKYLFTATSQVDALKIPTSYMLEWLSVFPQLLWPMALPSVTESMSERRLHMANTVAALLQVLHDVVRWSSGQSQVTLLQELGCVEEAAAPSRMVEIGDRLRSLAPQLASLVFATKSKVVRKGQPKSSVAVYGPFFTWPTAMQQRFLATLNLLQVPHPAVLRSLVVIPWVATLQAVEAPVVADAVDTGFDVALRHRSPGGVKEGDDAPLTAEVHSLCQQLMFVASLLFCRRVTSSSAPPITCEFGKCYMPTAQDQPQKPVAPFSSSTPQPLPLLESFSLTNRHQWSSPTLSVSETLCRLALEGAPRSDSQQAFLRIIAAVTPHIRRLAAVYWHLPTEQKQQLPTIFGLVVYPLVELCSSSDLLSTAVPNIDPVEATALLVIIEAVLPRYSATPEPVEAFVVSNAAEMIPSFLLLGLKHKDRLSPTLVQSLLLKIPRVVNKLLKALQAGLKDAQAGTQDDSSPVVSSILQWFLWLRQHRPLVKLFASLRTGDKTSLDELLAIVNATLKELESVATLTRAQSSIKAQCELLWLEWNTVSATSTH